MEFLEITKAQYEGGLKIHIWFNNNVDKTVDFTNLLEGDWAGITYESTPTALDNTEVDAKAVKVLRNGILLIEKNGHTYNAMGQLVK